MICCFSVPKKDPAVRDNAMSSVAPSLANVPAASRLDSSRPASTSHPDLRQSTVPQQRYGESAVSRLAPKTSGQNQRIGSDLATELRPGMDSTNSQRVLEWQMRNQMAKDAENSEQIQQRFDSAANAAIVVGSEQKPSYNPQRPQSQLIESGTSRPAIAASSLPQSTSVPSIPDTAVAYRGQMAASFQQQSSVAGMPSASTPMYSDDQRYSPRQLQPNMYNQFAASVQLQFSQMAAVRPSTSEATRYPFPGMVPQSMQHPGPRSDLPDLRQQLPVSGDIAQYRLSAGATSPTVSSEQKPNYYYPTRPQSELIEPGYVVSRPAQNASPLLQSTSMPAIADNVFGNHDQTVFNVQQQSSSVEKSFNTPIYSADQRYRPPQIQPSQNVASSAPAEFNQIANVRPQASDLARQPLPGMVPEVIQQPSSSLRSELPVVRPQPAVVGSSVQYRPTGGQYGMQDVTVAASDVRTEVPVSSIAAARPVDVPGLRYGLPVVYNQRPARPQDVRYEMSAVQNRAVPAGVPLHIDHNISKPYASQEVRYMSPAPGDVQYGMPNIAGETPSAAPSVRYNSSSSQGRLPEVVLGSSHEAVRGQPAVKFSQPSGHHESLYDAAGSYGSQETPYGMRSTSGSMLEVPAGMRYEPASTGDGWPLPPSPQERYGAPNVRSEFLVPPSAYIPPQNSQLSAPHVQNAGDGLKPLQPEVHVSLQNAVSSVPSVPPGMPTSDIRPKKQPPPVAAKPKLPASAGMMGKTRGITTRDDGKQLKPEKIQQKMLEIQRLESRPYLTAGEQTRLQNLRVEVEFDKRLADMNEKREDVDSEQHRMLPSMVRPFRFTGH